MNNYYFALDNHNQVVSSSLSCLSLFYNLVNSLEQLTLFNYQPLTNIISIDIPIINGIRAGDPHEDSSNLPPLQNKMSGYQLATLTLNDDNLKICYLQLPYEA